MSGRLVLTNGTISVSIRIADGSNRIALRQDSYRQQVGPSTGWMKHVVDEVEVVFRDANDSDSERGAIMRDLGYLRGLLEQRQQQGWVGERVWIESQTATETDIRYAEVFNITVLELGYRHWRVGSFPRMTLFVEREALWRETAIGGSWGNVFVNTTLYPCWDGSKKNRVAIAGADGDVAGDVAALTRIEIEQTGSELFDQMLIGAKVSTDEDALNRFVPFFNAVDETYHPAWQITDTSVPGGKRIEHAFSGTDTDFLYWNLPGSATWNDYAGSYLIYAVCEVSADDVIEVAFDQYNLEEPDVAQPAIFVPLTTGTKKHVLLGRYELNPEEILGETPDDVPIIFHIRYDGSATLKFFYLYLIPLDGGLCGVKDGKSIYQFFWDGDLRKRYEINSTGDLIRSTGMMGIGDFIQLYPGSHINTNLYFYGNYEGSDVDGSPLDRQIEMRVQAIGRYWAISNSE